MTEKGNEGVAVQREGADYPETQPRKVKNCAPWKGGEFQQVQVLPGDGSLQPEALGAAEEATNPPKPVR